MTSEPALASISTDEFLRNLAESGLSVSEKAPAAVSLGADGSATAERFVAAGLLTPFQAEAVLAGQFTALRKGNYDILDRLGAGGMGTVFKARHRRMKRVVALKVLLPAVAKAEMFAQRFQREVETIARLSHPNVVMAYDADEDDGAPFLVMEFVDGRDLANDVARGGPLSPADAVDCIRQAGRGLECAHTHGIVHRDIKPGNLMRDSAGVIKVADLGLARLNTPGSSAVDTSLTQAGGVVGTIDYMAPEQALDSTTVDARVDIYSLGCTLHFLLTDRPLYAGGSIMALLLKHRDGPIPSLCEARPDVPPELDAIFRRMVAKKPADRFATMTEVVRALEELIRTAPLADVRPARSQSDTPSGAGDQTTVFGAAAGAGTSVDTSRIVLPSETGVFQPVPDAGRAVGRPVVLVEPSRTQAGIIRRYLQQLGVGAVHVAGDGSKALELAKRERAVVVVSSMHLSDMSGVDLARALLADPECDGIGFVLATSESETEDTDAIPDCPRVVRMPKPFDLQRIAKSIAAACT